MSSFTFFRPVTQDCAAEISGQVNKILGPRDILRVKAGLHLTLLHTGNGLNQPYPPLLRFTTFDAARGFLGKNKVGPWDDPTLNTTGVVALRDFLMIEVEKPDWLPQERSAIRKVSGLRHSPEFADKNYKPHITVASFIGAKSDYKEFYECEALLQDKLEVSEVHLGTVALISDTENWQFVRRTSSASEPHSPRGMPPIAPLG